MRRGYSEDEQALDQEWVSMMLDARSIGLTSKEVRQILSILQEQSRRDASDSAV